MSAGDHLLQAETPGQTVQILVSSPFPLDVPPFNSPDGIQGLDLYIVVNNDSGPAPLITAVDIIGPGTIFDGNNTGQGDFGPPYQAPGLQVVATTTTGSGTVDPNGILAFVTFDTTGVPFGDYPWSLTSPLFGPSDFAAAPGSDAILIDGVLTVVPEPASIVMGLFAAAGLGAVMIRRRRAKA
ncbi:MAG: PEP-CTERM sorting domain-containing protein [Planctomycetota bacterium]|nr:MAG: PEP-CTERM sorting domain-containing protein [Planctomycetota bacterium]